MQITELRLLTRDVPAQQVFYTTVLGLPLVEAGPSSCTIQAGTTRLSFAATSQDVAMYHLAFNIPRNMLPRAKTWLGSRVRLLQQEGQDEFAFPSWQARAVYFHDAAGNLLELIARQTLPNDAQGSFSPHALLCVSEIGLPMEDVSACVDALRARLGIAPYKEQSATFAPLGDEQGLILVTAVGRPWGLTQVAARVAPVSLTVRGPQGEQSHLPRLPDDLL